MMFVPAPIAPIRDQKLNESILQGQLLTLCDAELPPEFVVQKHSDRIDSGIPDFSVDGNKITSWWEIKWADPVIRWDGKTKGIQLLQCRRLEQASNCHYIVYQRTSQGLWTVLVRPSDMFKNAGDIVTVRTVALYDRIDHQAIVRKIKEIHKCAA